MVVIRGATTIAQDSKEEIRRAVKELLEQIENLNGIVRGEIVSIVFSSTSDIHSYYPARAARDAGFESASLFSAQEPDINGGLELCIRVMLFVEKNIPPRHVYLRGAKVLRRDITHYTIAIDGPAGSGKSTVAKILAQKFNILYLDTGAMYRACALKVLEEGADPEDETAVLDVMRPVHLDIAYEEGVQHTFLDAKDVSEAIRRPEISMVASTVSKHPGVRMHLVEKQREIASRMSCVLDGRDIGTFVLPDADFKFFLTASPRIRAERRYAELKASGAEVDLDALEKEIAARDRQDMTRAFAPLKQAEDALLVDTTELTVDEVVAKLEAYIREKF